MLPRVEGEIAKLIQIENGWNVVLWDPEAPKPAVLGQPPCSQQPVRWWKTYSFATSGQAVEFLRSFLADRPTG